MCESPAAAERKLRVDVSAGGVVLDAVVRCRRSADAVGAADHDSDGSGATATAGDADLLSALRARPKLAAALAAVLPSAQPDRRQAAAADADAATGSGAAWPTRAAAAHPTA